MLSIYTSHDRDLLFHGTIEEAKAAGVRLHTKTREVTVNGNRRKVVNQASQPGHLSLWVTS